MVATVIPSPLFLKIDLLKLGRFIKDIDQPHKDYYDPQTADVLKVVFHEFSCSITNQHDAQKELGPGLASLLSAGLSKRLQAQIQVVTEYSVNYQLDSSDAWFDKVVSLPATRQWIENASSRGDKVYFIVGIQTFLNTRIAQKSTQEQQVEGEAKMPVSLSLEAVAEVMPLAELVDPTDHEGQREMESDDIWVKLPGQQACSIQCREVKIRRLSRRPVGLPQLSNARRWSCNKRDKGDVHGEEDDGENMIEVNLEDVNELSGQWNTQDSAEGTIYLQP
ncbi:hypothetical protein AUP68_04122 [Ilyonectria robusta]